MRACECGCGAAAPIAQKTDTRRGHTKGAPIRFIPGHQLRAAGWKGGVRHRSDGYVQIYRPEHPRSSDGYIFEHILIVESALRRHLRAPEEVHHVDGDRAGNRPTNLVACPDRAYHLLLECRTRALDACGFAHFRKCPFCKTYDDPASMVEVRGGFVHRECRNASRRARYANIGR